MKFPQKNYNNYTKKIYNSHSFKIGGKLCQQTKN